ncbi:MAG: FliC/FljB family flagellin [Serratia liquefaciens]|jgi:flagellin|uniref:FliC/FljB family flagellin n=1 Tax=Serratia liquefaciens TaxID=614 RepID=UPI00141C0B28|nr:FliC/FljB family flagellin [Serratia liquefaciens]MBF8105651.1 FliC/FljB family flagellin [Serratia liquefaciens]MCH4194963.1 FliC/FljB family flagellin [Serratia liquefaciens]MCH4233053.1 FliC/FljB family flagellin [Serratia liquefaciens]MCH4262647.1 FliC/FljB family flagellin [Serratia liquefaciens]MCI1215882.1 FliC/FljB family flagellin [Serratia liquefaciens]
MAQVINTNSLSLMAQNNLNKSQSSLGTAIERLSSGLRINSAKDDAAGQAISNRFTANIKGLTQASRNANDGISLAQTTEGALNEVNDNLQNIRRLTVQAQNGSNSSSDLQSIQDEITQRLSEIDRISQQTDFNGVKVLSSDQKLTVQVGANDGETIEIDLKNINKDTLGLQDFSVASKTNNKVGAAVTTVDKTVAASTGTKTGTPTPTLDGTDPYASYTEGGVTKYAVKDDAGKYYAATVDASGKFNYDTGKDVSTAAAAGGVTAVKDVAVAGKTNVTGLAAGEELHSYTDSTGKAGFVVKSKDADGNTVYNNATVDGKTGAVTKGAVNTDAKDPLATLDKALAQVDGLRSSLGAVQNRFDSVINNLNSTVNNLSASQSRIQDADYATEVSNMSRANILQQAGTSVLAQANQSTQNVLSLLR